MSAYHSIELCYLAAVYTNLLVRDQAMELHFKPKASSFPDGILRVAPDLLPAGRVKLSNVWVDDEPYPEFDKVNLTVQLPKDKEVRVRVRLVSTNSEFDSHAQQRGGEYHLTLIGTIPKRQVNQLIAELERALLADATRLILIVDELESLSEDAINALFFFRSKVKLEQEVVIVGASATVMSTFTSCDSSTGGEFVYLEAL